MAQEMAEALQQVQEELRLVQAKLVALVQVVEEVVFCQAFLALDPAGEYCQRAAAAVQLLRKVADMEVGQPPHLPGSARAVPQSRTQGVA